MDNFTQPNLFGVELEEGKTLSKLVLRDVAIVVLVKVLEHRLHVDASLATPRAKSRDLSQRFKHIL